MKNYDLVVIGAGPGGYVAAIRAAQLGLKTCCIDKFGRFGGTCLNVGCIPSKALLQSTEVFEMLKKQGKEHGVLCADLSIDFDTLMKRKDAVVKSLTDGIEGLFKKNKVDGIFAEAKITGPNTVLLSNGESIESKWILLATGSAPIALPFLPFDENQVVSSTGALSLKKIPKKLVVVGAGVIGCELASVYQRLGAQVTIVEMLNEICTPMDGTMSKALLHELRKQGIEFHLGTKVVKGEKRKGSVALTIENKDGVSELEADSVLVAIGRRPFSTGLQPESQTIAMTPKGFVAVDSNFRTSVPSIFAIGDLIEGPMLAHRASSEGVAVAELLGGLKPQVNYMAIPSVVYTSPEVASVGLSEEEAKAKGLTVKIGKSYFKGNPRARAAIETEGLVKIIGEEKTGRVIGLHIISAHASEMIQTGVVAIEKRATLSDLADAPMAHPTLSEAIKEAAESALGRAIHLG